MDELERFKSPSTSSLELKKEIDSLDAKYVSAKEFIQRIKNLKKKPYFIYLKPSEVIDIMHRFDELDLPVKYVLNQRDPDNHLLNIEFYYELESEEFKETEKKLIKGFREEKVALGFRRFIKFIKEIVK